MKIRFVKAFSAALAAVLISSSFAGCSGSAKEINGEKTAVIINGESIPYGEFNLFTRYQQAQSYYYMMNLGLSSGQFWNSEYTYYVDENGNIIDTVSSGSSSDTSTDPASATEEGTEVTSTYGEYFKALMVEDLTELVVIRQKAESEYGLELNEEQTAAIDEAAQEFMSSNEDAEETYGVSLDMVKDLLEMYTYKSILKPYAVEDIDREVSDDEAAQSTILYLRLRRNTEDTSDTAASEEDEDVKTDSELLEDAQEVLGIIEEAGDITSDEAQEQAREVNEDFFAMEFSIGKDDTTFPDEVNEALATLGDDEVYAEVVETDDFYYILKMLKVFDEEATESEKENIIAERESTAYNEMIGQWTDEAEVEEQKCVKDMKVTDNEIYTMITPTGSDTESDTGTTSGSDTETTSESSAVSSSETGSGSNTVSDSLAE